MKKFTILLLITILLTGCTMVRINTNSVDNIINVILSKNNHLYNRVGKGYKYYVPRGVNYIDTDELNDKLYSNGNYYYLYIDAVSYYYNIDFEYQKDDNAYYSRLIDINDKKGYLEINKTENDKYYIEFMYNYSKIETIVDYDDINNAILNASYILSTVKFNNNVIKIMLNEEYFVNKEEKYDIFNSKKQSDTFLKYESDENKEMIDDSNNSQGELEEIVE